MTEWRFFEPPDVPEFTTAAWYADRPRAPHLEQEDHGERLRATYQYVRRALADTGAATVVDLGCGDGGLLSLLPDLDAWGYDLCPANVKAAREERGVRAELLDVVAHPGSITWADLAVCTEMFEHLTGPHAFARRIGKHCRAIVASSPANENERSHYEFHAWAWDMEGYRKLLEQAGFEVTMHTLVRGFQVTAGVNRALMAAEGR